MSEKVKNAGVIGAGGAGFPAHVKVDAEADTVIANGAECEPLLSTDRYLMVNEPEKIIAGLKNVRDSTGADKAIIALKEKYETAIQSLEAALDPEDNVELYLMENYYPAGDEVEMTYQVTGQAVPEGGIPLDVGVVVSNVNSLLNVHLAEEQEKPVTTRWITVAGELRNPFMAEVPIGTKAGELVDLAQPLADDYVLIDGGPMTGEIVDRDHGATKTSGALIVLPPDNTTAVRKQRTTQTEYKRGQSMCDQCFECTIVCPRNLIGYELHPDKIMRNLFISPEESKAELATTYLCCECGLCDMYACPMDLSPRDVIVQIQEELQEAGVENPHDETDLEPHPEREYRKVNASKLMIRLQLDQYDLHDFPVEEVLPEEVSIALDQNIGAPSQPVVKEGESVEKGQLIADIPPEALGSKVHASISGTVTEITDNQIEISTEAQ